MTDTNQLREGYGLRGLKRLSADKRQTKTSKRHFHPGVFLLAAGLILSEMPYAFPAETTYAEELTVEDLSDNAAEDLVSEDAVSADTDSDAELIEEEDAEAAWEIDAEDETEGGFTADVLTETETEPLIELSGEDAENLYEIDSFEQFDEEIEDSAILEDPMVSPETNDTLALSSGSIRRNAARLYASAGTDSSYTPYNYGEQITSSNAAYFYQYLVDLYVTTDNGYPEAKTDISADAVKVYAEDLPELYSYTANDSTSLAAAKASLLADVQTAWDAFNYDYPQVYWYHADTVTWSRTKSGDHFTSITLVCEEAYDGAADSAEITAYNAAVTKVVDSLQSDADYDGDGSISQIELAQAAHDYVCDRMNYAYSGLNRYSAQVTEQNSLASAYTSAQTAYNSAKTALTAAQEAYTSAKAAYETAQTDGESEETLAALQADMEDANNTLTAAQQTEAAKAILLEDAKEAYNTYKIDYTIFCNVRAFLDTGDNTFVCEGYSRTYKLLCDRLGLAAVLIPGKSSASSSSSSMGHMWNAVKIDGTWYLVDATWDGQSSATKYTYFIFAYNTIGDTRSPYSRFSLDSGGAQTFSYPTISTAEHTYEAEDEVSSTGYTQYVCTDNDGVKYSVLAGMRMSLSFAEASYTGTEVKPDIIVQYGADVLTENIDYTVSFSNHVDTGTASVTVTGIGSYSDSGTLTQSFIITPYTLGSSADSVSLSNDSVSYTGSALTPVVTVKANGNTLTADTDYTVSCSGNTNAGTATVTVTGRGNYSGTLTKTFTITKRGLDSMILSYTSAVYTGSALTPAVTVKANGKTLTAGTDYTVSCSENTNAGTAAVTVTGRGNYSGTLTKTFTITKRSLDSMSLSYTSAVYTGSALTPVVTVKANGKTLTAGTDYTVSCSENTNAGTAAVTVTGKGNYSGTLTKTFTITKRGLDSMSLSYTSAVYTGLALKPAVTVKANGKTLTAGTDYTVSYSGNTNTGTATVTVMGRGNYSGSLSKNFTIKPAGLTSATLSFSKQIYTGKAFKPGVLVKSGNSTLKAGTDYSVSYSKNKAIGTALVTISGRGNYSGTLTKTFTIVPKTAAITSIYVNKKTAAQVFFKLPSGMTGCEIQYSPKASFASASTVRAAGTKKKAVLKKLKTNKIYYVRIRCYKTVSGTKYYSSWSKRVKIKVILGKRVKVS